jgi:hypothetical protein
MKFSATVKDRQTGELIHIENKEYPNITAFRKDLARNGFSIHKNHIAESERYNFILNYTNGESWHWDIKQQVLRDISDRPTVFGDLATADCGL